MDGSRGKSRGEEWRWLRGGRPVADAAGEVPEGTSVDGVGEDLRGAPLLGDGPEGVGVDDGDLVGQRDVTGDTQPCRSSRGANPSDGVFEPTK